MIEVRELASAAALLAAVALSACSGREVAEDTAQTPPPSAAQGAAPPIAPAPPAPAPTDNATVGGDGSAIQLSALSASDLAATPLAGELGCNFATATSGPLLVAMGNVASRDPAFGLVKVSDYVERIAAPGGYDGMLKSAVFTGAGKTIRIVVTGPATGGGEAPQRPATLTYERADGASLTVPGRWECGP